MDHPPDDRPLATVVRSPADPVIPAGVGATTLLHGFTQNARCWGLFGELLAARAEVTRVDLPGHGLSGHDSASLTEAAELVAASTRPSTWIGYSLGGRVALHGALNHPAEVQALVVIGAHAGIDTAEERAARTRLDHQRADRLLAIGLDAWLDDWLRLPMFARLDPAAASRAERLTNRAAGLAASLRHCGTGTQVPLWDRLHHIEVPTLIIAGALDERFATIGSRMADHIGSNAQLALVPDAGHACHLEAPARTGEIIGEFIASWSER